MNETAKVGIKLIKEGKIRNHKIGNSAQVHTGTVERREVQLFRDFLPCKNGCMLYQLTGSDNNA